MRLTLIAALFSLAAGPAFATDDTIWIDGCESAPLKVSRLGELAELEALQGPILKVLSSRADESRSVSAAFSNADLSLLVTYSGLRAVGQVDNDTFETVKATFLKTTPPLPDNVHSVNPGPFKEGSNNFRQSYFQVLDGPGGEVRHSGYGDVWVHFGSCIAVIELVALSADLDQAARLLDLIVIP